MTHHHPRPKTHHQNHTHGQTLQPQPRQESNPYQNSNKNPPPIPRWTKQPPNITATAPVTTRTTKKPPRQEPQKTAIRNIRHRPQEPQENTQHADLHTDLLHANLMPSCHSLRHQADLNCTTKSISMQISPTQLWWQVLNEKERGSED